MKEFKKIFKVSIDEIFFTKWLHEPVTHIITRHIFSPFHLAV
jgi:hypothetical protein